MKKCPFCAEEIKDEAIKCRYCGSFLSAAPKGAEPRTAATSGGAGQASAERPLAPAAKADSQAGERRVLYSGSPSWRAFLGEYAALVLATLLVPFAANWVAGKLEASTFTRVLAAGIPLLMGVLAFFAIQWYRRSKVFRVTTTNIETEYGLLSKRIDVLELWRCRDVRYRQSLLDRILGIAHIEIFTADVTTPNLCIVGLPASRELFEKIRDSIEIQRQARNVVGFVQ